MHHDPDLDEPTISYREIPPPPGSSPDLSPASRRAYTFFYRLGELQMNRPLTFIVVAIALVVGSLLLAFRLEIRPGFEELLPKSRESVQELERVKEHTRGVSSVFVVLEGDDTAAMRKAADAIAAEVAKIERPWVGSVESGLHEARKFLQPRVGLFASRAKLQKLRDDIEERYEYEVGKATGANLEFDDEQPPPLSMKDVKKRFGIDQEAFDRYPDGYFQSKDGRVLVVAIQSGVLGSEYDKGHEALRRIREAVERVNPASYHGSIRYGLSGDLVSSISEYTAINDDLTEVGMWGAIFIIGIVFLYYLRGRTLVSLILIISVGVAVTFGATELLIGQLNMATGFLFTIIAGNGINPGIIYMARYLEARRLGVDPKGAVRLAHRDTWLPTLAAKSAAAAAYGSLLVTEFRGFRDFGIIGMVGELVCWICTFAFLPSILVMTERVAPLDSRRSGLFGLLPKVTVAGTRFGTPFALLVERAPRVCTIVGGALFVLAIAGTVRWIKHDPMEYNLENLRSDVSARAEEQRLGHLAEDITGFVGADGMAILTDRPEQVPELVERLEQKRDAAPPDQKPFSRVHTLQDFVPGDQKAKIPILLSIKEKIMLARKQGVIKDQDFAAIAPFLPPEHLKPFDIHALPDDIARAFTERDGTRGRIVYISPSGNVSDAHYLFRWAESYRHTELSDGSVVRGSGRAVIYADIWAAVLQDVPRAVAVSLLLTLVAVGLAFRRGFASALVISALAVGAVWMTGALALGGVRLNFLNFIALPITFGIGVDYAVNVMQRYRREGRGGAAAAVRETGGAVVLCSLTTTLGYLALVSSVNFAVRSLGIAAVVGELTCVLAAVILLPAVLHWRDSWANRRGVVTDKVADA